METDALAFEDELRRFVEVRCAGSTSRRAARDFLDSLDERGQRLLERWLVAHAEQLLYQAILRIRPDPSTHQEPAKTHPVVRSRVAPTQSRQTPAASFGAAVEGFSRGDVEALSNFRLVYQVRGTEKHLGEMTGNDHLMVAETFQRAGSSSLLLAAIHRRIGRALGGRRTEDVFSEDQYRQVFAHSFKDDGPGCIDSLRIDSPLKAITTAQA